MIAYAPGNLSCSQQSVPSTRLSAAGSVEQRIGDHMQHTVFEAIYNSMHLAKETDLQDKVYKTVTTGAEYRNPDFVGYGFCSCEPSIMCSATLLNCNAAL